jgi:LysM repeat protein
MSGVVDLISARCWRGAVALALVTISVAACSGDLSRLQGGLFSSSDSADMSRPVAPTQATPAAQADSVQQAAQQPGSATRAPNGNWSWDGGKAITVARGETLDSIAKRHRVPASAILEANKITEPSAIRAGQRLVIPRSEKTQVASAVPGSYPAAAATTTGPAAVHVVAAGDTLSKISFHYGKSVGEIVKANNIPINGALKVGDRLVIPGPQTESLPRGSR